MHSSQSHISGTAISLNASNSNPAPRLVADCTVLPPVHFTPQILFDREQTPLQAGYSQPRETVIVSLSAPEPSSCGLQLAIDLTAASSR